MEKIYYKVTDNNCKLYQVIDDFIKNFKKTKNTIVGEMSHNDKTLI